MRKIILKKKLSILTLILFTFYLSSCVHKHLHSSEINGIPSDKSWFATDPYAADSISVLVKKNETDYKVLMIADIQIDKGNNKGRKHALSLVTKLIEATQPDFIITLGDNTQGHYSDKMTTIFIDHMEQYKIPWAPTLGNHDDEGRRGRAWHGNQYESAPNSLFKYGPSNIHGVGNYTVFLKDEEGNIIYSFIMLDSNTYRNYESIGHGYDFIYSDQIDWYQWQVKGASITQYGQHEPKEGKVVPTMAFFHIPLLEFADAAQAVADGTIDSADVVGENKEQIFAAKVNSGLFTAMKSLESTTHVFCGHDHINNMSVDWQGIKLSYGLKTGHTSYFDNEMQGGTLMTIKTGDSFKSPEVEIEYIYITE